MFLAINPPENYVYKQFNSDARNDYAFPVKKYKNVYNNVFEILINADLLDYKTNAKTIEHQKHDEKNHTLIIGSIQKLEDDFQITITTQQNETKEITMATSKFTIFFKNI